MRRIAKIALLVAALFTSTALAGCTNKPEDVTRVLAQQGLTNIELTGHRWLGCGKDDSTADGFAATGVTGQRVTGVVCGSFGWGKSFTVRYD